MFRKLNDAGWCCSTGKAPASFLVLIGAMNPSERKSKSGKKHHDRPIRYGLNFCGWSILGEHRQYQSKESQRRYHHSENS